MTLEHDISKLIENRVKEFINKIHVKYDINKDALMALWTCGSCVLEKKSKAELVEMCKDAEVSYNGNKKELIARLLKSNTRLQNDYKVIISKNKHGYYEHCETKFVFNKVDKVVIGKQLDTGEIAELTMGDIDVCNQYNFEYTLPENLHEDDDDSAVLDDAKEDNSDHEFSDYIEDDD